VRHVHAEYPPRHRHGSAVDGIADPARTVDRGVLRRFDKAGEDGFGRGFDGDASADRVPGHSPCLLAHGVEPKTTCTLPEPHDCVLSTCR
jgi:hypothetical protein